MADGQPDLPTASGAAHEEIITSMEHRGLEYRVIQGISRSYWKWSVDIDTGTKTGTSKSRDAAARAAKRAIDGILDPKRAAGTPAVKRANLSGSGEG